MRILWASHLVPYPPKSGVHIRSYNLLRGVAAKHDVDLLAFVQEPWLKAFYGSREEALEECERELLRFCRSVRFLPIDRLARPGGKWRTAVEGLIYPQSYTTRWLSSRDAGEAFAQAARTESYGLAHFDTISLAPFRAFFPGTVATLGHHNIESHLLQRRALSERSLLKRWYFLEEGRRVARYEKKIAGSFAAHIACSTLDCERLRAIAPHANAVTIPNGVDVDYFRPASGANRAASVIFVGSLNWYPNVDAVLFLLDKVWPVLKARVPDLRLDVVGTAPPQAILERAASLPDVTIHGFVSDVRPFMESAAVYVCPIRDGGGTKLKILDAFSMRKCVVAHPIACEGIDVEPGRHVQFADSPQAFVREIERLLQDPDSRERMGTAARQLVLERYTFSQIAGRLCEVFEEVAGG